MNIDGVAAIVTGGASGLGKATAKMLAANGARVALFDLNEETGKAAAKEIGGVFVSVNVADDASVTAGLDAAEKANGPARILVNCAGIAPAVKTVGKENKPHPLDAFTKTVMVNLVGTFNCISKFAARCAALDEVDGERGVITCTASVAAFDGQIGQAAYSASKGGVVGMTLPVARDLAQHKIRHLPDADARGVSAECAGCARRAGPAPGTARQAGRICPTDRIDRAQPDAQRRGDPSRRRDPHGAAVIHA
jgi:NAD(P)-dependent dehydrogenase (short-subunit alcohol dehydrogenase family)